MLHESHLRLKWNQCWIRLTAVVGATDPLSIVADDAPGLTIAGCIRNAIEEDLRAAFIGALYFGVVSVSKGNKAGIVSESSPIGKVVRSTHL